jgi:hypothetical protein
LNRYFLEGHIDVAMAEEEETVIDENVEVRGYFFDRQYTNLSHI